MLSIINKDANKDFQFSKAKAIDVEGNDYNTYDINIGITSIRSPIFTDTPIKVSIKFKKVLPAMKILKLVDVKYYNPETVGRELSFQLNDLDVIWK